MKPLVKYWLELTSWFVKQTHVNEKCDRDFEQSELVRQFQQLESVLSSALLPFCDTLSEINDIPDVRLRQHCGLKFRPSQVSSRRSRPRSTRLRNGRVKLAVV